MKQILNEQKYGINSELFKIVTFAAMRNLRWKIAQSAEIRWWQRYLQRKPASEYLKWKQAYWKTFLQQCGIFLKTGETALDAGCGPAGIFTILKDHKVDAVDPLIDRYDEKLDHFKKSSYPNVTFFAETIEDFKPEKPYDFVFCLNAINHVDSLEICMDKLVDCLRPGGKLIISFDAHNHQLFKRIFRLIPGDILHPHQHDLKEYKHMLVSRNLTIANELLYRKSFLFNYYVLVCLKENRK